MLTFFGDLAIKPCYRYCKFVFDNVLSMGWRRAVLAGLKYVYSGFGSVEWIWAVLAGLRDKSVTSDENVNPKVDYPLIIFENFMAFVPVIWAYAQLSNTAICTTSVIIAFMACFSTLVKNLVPVELTTSSSDVPIADVVKGFTKQHAAVNFVQHPSVGQVA
jgi:hypothetical protein